MARYRHKDSVDLAWNRIRRRLTMELDVQIKDWREDALNHLLAGAWEKYSASIGTGEVLELEAHYNTWVSKALNDSVSVEADREAGS